MASEVSNQTIFLEECRRDPEFRNRALGLERMLRVKVQKETNIRDFENGVDSDSFSESVSLSWVRPLLRRLGVASEFAVGAASAEASGVASELVAGAASAEASERAATAGESQGIIGLRERYESDFPSLNSPGCLSVDARARAALPAASASLSSSAFPSASLAVVAHARSTPMHDRLRVPREGGVPKLGFPVRPKIFFLSQKWRQG